MHCENAHISPVANSILTVVVMNVWITLQAISDVLLLELLTTILAKKDM